MKKESDAYFTVEAAILYPIILSVILLMTYLLLFQYDRCLLEQDIGKATVLSGSKWTLTKEQLNDYMQKKALHFDEEKYIAWENEDPLWNLRYPFAGMGTQEKYWSAKASFKVDRISPVFWLRRSRNVQNKRDNTEENN